MCQPNEESNVTGDASEEEVWQTRTSHRLEGVAAVKRSLEYRELLVAERVHGSVVRPKTPDPYDRSVVKRKWERGMQIWRKHLTEAVDTKRKEYFD